MSVKGVDAAILRYTGARQVEPTTSKTGFEALKEQNLVVRFDDFRAHITYLNDQISPCKLRL